MKTSGDTTRPRQQKISDVALYYARWELLEVRACPSLLPIRVTDRPVSMAGHIFFGIAALRLNAGLAIAPTVEPARHRVACQRTGQVGIADLERGQKSRAINAALECVCWLPGLAC